MVANSLVDDRTFRVHLVGDGASTLRDRVKEKLKEFMGDYTDDTLVEYVIVLLRNGRNKDEARSELNVFLGDDSGSFVSWLWDHLVSNLDVYMQARQPSDVVKGKVQRELTGKIDPVHADMEPGGEKSGRLNKSRHNREWKTLARDATETPPLRSLIASKVHLDVRSHGRRENQNHSPERAVQRKRNRADNHHSSKRVGMFGGTNGAPRRLLQFAVRDAVGTARPSKGSPERAAKRIRSVVSTPGSNDLIDTRTQQSTMMKKRLHSAAVEKALTEAAEDIKRPKFSASVFDRLGQTKEPDTLGGHEEDEYEEGAVSGEYEEFQKSPECTHTIYNQKSSQYVGDLSLVESDTGLASDSTSDNERYADYVNANARTDRERDEKSTMADYSIIENTDESVRRELSKDLDKPASMSNASRKIVNISVNVNTWKPSHYQSSKGVGEVDMRTTQQASSLISTSKSDGASMKVQSHMPTPGNGNLKSSEDYHNKPRTITQSQSVGVAAVQNPSNPTVVDADSRTIFVSNVHFAATKEGLSRHFSKTGQVLKVVIITDATTGKPKGAACVEFTRKEAAEHALSLDGTSFLSRILKVVRKSAASREAVVSQPRAARAPSRFIRSFHRGAFRARSMIKPGAKSLQWKRDGLPTQTNPHTVRGGRGMTYIRPQSKPETRSGSAT